MDHTLTYARQDLIQHIACTGQQALTTTDRVTDKDMRRLILGLRTLLASYEEVVRGAADRPEYAFNNLEKGEKTFYENAKVYIERLRKLYEPK